MGNLVATAYVRLGRLADAPRRSVENDEDISRDHSASVAARIFVSRPCNPRQFFPGSSAIGIARELATVAKPPGLVRVNPLQSLHRLAPSADELIGASGGLPPPLNPSRCKLAGKSDDGAASGICVGSKKD